MPRRDCRDDCYWYQNNNNDNDEKCVNVAKNGEREEQDNKNETVMKRMM